MSHVTKEDLLRDLGVVADDLEALVLAAKHDASEKVTAARTRAERVVKTVKDRLAEVEHQVADKARVAVKEADQYVREHAWETVAAAAKVGIFVGLALHERKRKP